MKRIAQIAKLDVHTVLIIILILVSTGHVGQLFARRESGQAWALGYVFALALDGVLVVSLHQVARSFGWARAISFAVFVAACAVSAGFNFQYYRETSPLDPMWVSALLGFTSPVLASLVSVLRALKMGTIEETQRQHKESDRQRELDHLQAMETIRLGAETKVQIAEATAKEARLLKNAEVRLARVQETQRQAQESDRQQAETLRQQIESLGNERATYEYFQANPHAAKKTAAIALDVAERTVGNHLVKLRALGLMGSNGSGVEVLEMKGETM